MLKKLTITGLALSAFVLGTQQANANAKVRDVSISVQNTTAILVNVTGADNHYDTISSGSVDIPIHAKAKVTNASLKYKIHKAHVRVPSAAGKYVDPPASSYAQSFLVAHYYPRKFDETKTMYLPIWVLGNHKSRIIDVCNTKISQGQSTDTDSLGQYTLPLKLWAKAGKGASYGSTFPPFEKWGEGSDETTAPINVVCKAMHRPPETASDFEFDHGEFAVSDIDLFLSTFSGATTNPNPATTCKKGRVLVRLKANQAGPAKFKLWTKVGGAPMTSKVIDAWASHDGNGGFKAEHTEWVSIDKTSFVQTKAEEMVSGFGNSTPWKDITLQCSSKEGGGLTVGLDQPMAPERTLKGDFTFIDHGAPKCTRQGKVLVSFKTNKSGNIHYSLDCTNGQHLSGVAQTVKSPQGGYVAASLQTFDISNTTVYSCSLKTVAPGPVKLHQWKSHKFDCVNRAVETGSNDIQVAPKPTDAQPRNPRVPATLIPNALDKAKADAIKRRREAAKKAQAEAAAKRKREAAARRVKAAKKKAEADAAAKRKREAAIAAVKRKTAAKALAKRKAVGKIARKRKTSSNNTRTRVMRLR